MACSYPLRAIRVGENVIVKKRSDLVGTDLGKYIDLLTGEYVEPFDIPCGKCLQCRLDYAKTWSNRCLLEAQNWSHNWFLTLTYDDENLHFGKEGINTLFADDLKNFLKSLREYYDRVHNHQGIRFYACGEYGDNTFRPHYHMLAFNLPLDGLRLYSKSPMGDFYYISDVLNKIWGKGFVVVGELTAESAAYTARYCQKKASKEPLNYDDMGVQKEFVRMSRKPGIGAFYYEKNSTEILATDKIYLSKGRIVSSFRYFDKLAEREGESLDYIKSQRRQRAELRQGNLIQMVSEDYNKYLLDLEEVHSKRAKMLKRNL